METQFKNGVPKKKIKPKAHQNAGALSGGTGGQESFSSAQSMTHNIVKTFNRQEPKELNDSYFSKIDSPLSLSKLADVD